MLDTFRNADDESLAQSGKHILVVNSLAAVSALLGIQFSFELAIVGVGTLSLMALLSGMLFGPLVRKRLNISDEFRRQFESATEKNPTMRMFSTLAGTLAGQSIAVALVGLLFYISGWQGANEMMMVGGMSIVPALGLLFYVIQVKVWDGPLVALAYRMFLPPILTGLLIAATALNV